MRARSSAAAIHSSLLAETGAKDAGLLERSFAVLRETAKPAVLPELGYIDNFAENQQIRDSHYQDKLVAGIVKGIQKYYAGGKKGLEKPEAFSICLLSIFIRKEVSNTNAS